MSATTTTDGSLITARGYALLEAELDRLYAARRRLSEDLRDAREGGDAADGAVTVDLLADLAQVEARIATLEEELATARIARPAPRGRAGVGSAVRVRHLDSGRVAEYELVGPIDPLGDGRVSLAAPVGRALAGCRAGARVEVVAPRGVVALEVLSVRAAA